VTKRIILDKYQGLTLLAIGAVVFRITLCFFSMILLAGNASAANEKQLFACLASLGSENIPGKANGALIPLGTPTESSYLFESKNTDQRLRDYLLIEPDRVRYCKDNIRAGEAGFQLNLNRDKEKIRVEIKKKLDLRDKDFTNIGEEFIRYTKCKLVGENSCYLDIQPQCREVSLIKTPPSGSISRIAGKKADELANKKVAELIETLLKNLVTRRLSALSTEKQAAFLAKNDLRDCDFNFIRAHIAQFKAGAGLATPNTAPGEAEEPSVSSPIDILQ
jgi:hypothetical protein